jgi:hypothetical protein
MHGISGGLACEFPLDYLFDCHLNIFQGSLDFLTKLTLSVQL